MKGKVVQAFCCIFCLGENWAFTSSGGQLKHTHTHARTQLTTQTIKRFDMKKKKEGTPTSFHMVETQHLK
jgi:hypothetical protein